MSKPNPTPQDGRPLHMTVEFEPTAVPMTGGTTHAVITVQAPALPETAARPPLRLAIVIDRSGSMHGRPLELASAAAQLALGLLRQDDEFALVFFANVAEVAMGIGPATRERVQAAVRMCQQVTAHGGTHLSSGWGLGCQQLAVDLAPGSQSLCLLLSDGHANAGETNPQRLAEHAAVLRQSGIATTCVGLGPAFDEVVLDGMARAGDGRFYFAETPESLPAIFANEVGDALQVVAPGVVLSVASPSEPRGAWRQLSAFRDVPMPGGLGIALGDLCSGQQVTVALELRTEATSTPMAVDHVFALTAADGTELARCRATLAVLPGDEAAAQPRNPALWRTIVERRIHWARLQALPHNSAGQGELASERLLREARELAELSGPLQAEVNDLLWLLHQEAQRLRRQLDEMDYKRAYSESTYANKGRTRAGTSIRTQWPDGRRS